MDIRHRFIDDEVDEEISLTMFEGYLIKNTTVQEFPDELIFTHNVERLA